jgi:hypothetical protein
MSDPLSAQLAVSGHLDLSTYDSRATTGFTGKKADAAAALATIGDELGELQERLFAGGRTGTSDARVLVVLQGMDTSGTRVSPIRRAWRSRPSSAPLTRSSSTTSCGASRRRSRSRG